MQKKSFNIGIDVGNFDTKTQSTTTSSGFDIFSKIPYGATEALYYEEMYYVPDIERFPYKRDKTDDNKCFILSLFGVAKEIITSVSSKCDCIEEVQAKIDNIKEINLGVGLPPAHMSLLKDKLLEYYRSNFSDGIEFGFYYKVGSFDPHIYNFKISLGAIDVYPQDLAAALVAPALLRKNNDPEFLTNKYKKSGYYAIDIGGYTVDVVPIFDGAPRVSKCDSLELGILRLYGEIEKTINNELGYLITDANIESVLLGEPTPLKPEAIKIINESAEEWINLIINKLVKGGLEFNSTPVIFMGGGSALLKRAIKSNENVAKCEHVFMTNSKANAIGYRAFIAKTA